MLSMQLSKRFVQQIVLDGFAFVGILNNLLDCYKYGIGKRELESVAAAVGLDALCDRESKAYRESVIAYTQSRDSILAGLMEKPQLLKLPIVRDGRRATVGYCPEIWEAWLKG